MDSHRFLRRKAVVGAVAGVAVLAAATSAWAITTGNSGAVYRLATVGRNDVVQSLTTTGAVSPIDSSDLDFQVAGEVGRVYVKAGDHVRPGQRVARLDRSAVRAAVTAARATLSDARATLASDEASQTTSSSTSSTASPSGSATATPTPTPTSQRPPSGGNATAARIARDQAALVAAQHRADQDLATTRTAMKAATAACAAELNPSPTNGADGTPSSSSTPDPTTCTDATKILLSDQTTVSADQDAVARAETTLDRDLTAALGSTRATTASFVKAATTVPPRPSPTASDNAAQSGRTVPSAGATETVTASHLASDQAAIDTDRATVATAVASLAQATLTSPIAGTVKAVTISKGDTVSGTSSTTTPAIEIVGSKQSKVTIELSAAQVRSIRIGMTARVIADGAEASVVGHVIAIGLTATSSDTGSVTYPVDVALSAHATSLVSGADAEVVVDVATAHNVISVPTSAVHRSGATSYVQVLRAGRPVRVTVKVGAAGASVTQIRSGLTVGQHVVLANLNAAVPSSSTNLPTGRTGLGGGFSFSVGPGGGFGGAAPGTGPAKIAP
jgi:HlyD family secretion protein